MGYQSIFLYVCKFRPISGVGEGGYTSGPFLSGGGI